MSKKHNSTVRDEYVTCRAIGHSWKYHDAWKDGRDFKQVLTCRHCPTRRTDTIDGRTGAVKPGRKYEYPEGYVLDHPITAAQRGKVRIRAVINIADIARPEG